MTKPARPTALRDASALRLTISLALAVLAWAAMLALGSRLLLVGDAPVPPPDTIEMKLVEAEPPPAPAPSSLTRPILPHPAAALAMARKAPREVAPARSAALGKPSRPATPRDAPAPEAKITHEPDRTSSTTTPTEPAAAPTPNASPSNRAPSPDGAGSAPARVLAQPLPALPDDLREEAFRVVAVARFDIHANGTVDVELVKPTSNPRLNRVLLDVLRTWRFAPAMENGRPVESRQDVRVHFNVS